MSPTDGPRRLFDAVIRMASGPTRRVGLPDSIRPSADNRDMAKAGRFYGHYAPARYARGRPQ